MSDGRDRCRRGDLPAIDRHLFLVGHLRGIAPRDDREHAAELWRGLLEGRWEIVDRFESGPRRCLVLRRADDGDSRALTLRERQVIGFVALGHPNKLAAAALGLAESSVSTHLSTALHKLGLRNRCELVALMAALCPLR